MAHSTNWCEFPGDFNWDMTADYGIDLMEVCDDGPGGSCSDDCSGGFCGDGVVYGSEVCDSGPDNATCGFCNSNCTGPYNRCGDSQVLCGESCDDGPGGTCHDDCTAVNVCGDGRIFAGEACDDGGDNGTCGHCNATCTGPHNVCGDSQVLCGEVCDDGNLVNGDGCESDCGLACGAGTGALRATFDAGSNTCYLGFVSEADYLSSQSACVSLGGYLAVIDSAAENALAYQAAQASMWIGFNDMGVEAGSNPYLFQNVLDGMLTYSNFSPGEPNDSNAQEDCVHISTGGFWNDLDCTDALWSYVSGYLCELPNAIGYCGDGVVNPGEDCDDFANGNNCDGCTDDCQSTLVYCGNQSIECNEACDDGDIQGPGLCLNNCSGLQTCGDGTINGTENCDDWNALNDDGCSSACLLEPQPCLPSNVAVFSSMDPSLDYVTNSILGTLGAAGISYSLFPTSGMGVVDLSPFDKVVFPSSQGPAFLAAIQANATWLGNWIAAGGIWEFHFADWVGTPGYDPVYMPGGWGYKTYPYQYQYFYLNDTAVANAFHFIHRFPTTMSLNDYRVVGNYGDWDPPDSNGWIESSPPGTTWLVWDTGYVKPTMALIPFGSGYTLAAGQLLEWMTVGGPGYATIGPNGQQVMRNLLLFMPPPACP